MSGRGQFPGRAVVIYDWWLVFLCAFAGALVATSALLGQIADGHLWGWVLVEWVSVATSFGIFLFFLTVGLEAGASEKLDSVEGEFA